MSVVESSYSLVIVAGIIGAYGSALVNHKNAGWAGIAFIYIYDVNFSYSFGMFPIAVLGFTVLLIGYSTDWMGSALGDFQPFDSVKGYFDYDFGYVDVQFVGLKWYYPFIRMILIRNSIIGLVTPDMLSSITWGTYLFFAVFCLLAFAFTLFVIPETRGKVCTFCYFIMLLTNCYVPQTLEDMDLIFGDTAAHEEKQRIVHIEAQLRGVPLVSQEMLKDDIVQQEHAHGLN